MSYYGIVENYSFFTKGAPDLFCDFSLDLYGFYWTNHAASPEELRHRCQFSTLKYFHHILHLPKP